MNTPPFEILKALPLMDVIRLTFLVLKAKSIKDRTPFDEITAKEWIIDTAGESICNNFFLPLLSSKFGNNKEKVSAAWLLVCKFAPTGELREVIMYTIINYLKRESLLPCIRRIYQRGLFLIF